MPERDDDKAEPQVGPDKPGDQRDTDAREEEDRLPRWQSASDAGHEDNPS